MSFERRDFITIGAAGIFGTLFHAGPGLGQASPGKGGEYGHLKGGSGSLYLEGRLKKGTLKLDGQDFTDEGDRAVIIHATFDSTKFYQVMFTQDYGRTVFAQARDDNGHTTTVVVSYTDNPKINRLTVWNDREAPDSFRIDIENFSKRRNLKEAVLDNKGKDLDLLGKRKEPPFTVAELEDVFGADPALSQFMRGKRSSEMQSGQVMLDECPILALIPGFELLHLAWEAAPTLS
jgi:hypothetical protein